MKNPSKQSIFASVTTWNSNESISAVCGPMFYNLSSQYDTWETAPKLHQYFLQISV